MAKNIIYLTRRLRFSASHSLNNPNLDQEKNKSLFGNCSQNHGHNFELFITLKGIPNYETGMLINVREIKKIAETEVIHEFDHNDLNTIKEFKKLLPTTENICIVIWNRLQPHFKESLFEIKVRETENIEAFYRGE